MSEFKDLVKQKIEIWANQNYYPLQNNYKSLQEIAEKNMLRYREMAQNYQSKVKKLEGTLRMERVKK